MKTRKGENKKDFLCRNRQIFILRYRKSFIAKKMERAMGIEPTTSAWKAGVLPLNYTRLKILDNQNLQNIIHEMFWFVKAT